MKHTQPQLQSLQNEGTNQEFREILLSRSAAEALRRLKQRKRTWIHAKREERRKVKTT